jgi:hypothetical protein
MLHSTLYGACESPHREHFTASSTRQSERHDGGRADPHEADIHCGITDNVRLDSTGMKQRRCRTPVIGADEVADVTDDMV